LKNQQDRVGKEASKGVASFAPWVLANASQQVSFKSKPHVCRLKFGKKLDMAANHFNIA
jgi:hypothetical protein